VPTLLPSAEIEGVVIVEPMVHADERGTFVEFWRREWLPGVPEVLQANRSDKVAGSVVGLHYHLHQADYWYVVAGRARVVLHDLRRTSPTEGASSVVELEGSGHRALYVPPGVAHGFAALSDLVLFYFVDRTYDPRDELGVAWDDPDLGIDWGVDHPVLSARDAANPRRRDIPPGLVPRFQPPLSA
jgi:dTDP-4-dehydrorhamnose 3,5-epimerase